MPVVTDDLVIVSGGDGWFVFGDDTDTPGLWAFDKATGDLLWKTTLGGSWACQPVWASGIIYVTTNYDSWYDIPPRLCVFDVSKSPGDDPGFDLGGTDLIANSVAVINGNLYGTGLVD